MKVRLSIISLVLGLASMVALFCVLNWNAAVVADAQVPNAPTADLTVCSSGCDYSSIQDAVEAANSGDVIKVATGTYADVTRINLGGRQITQVVYLGADTVPIITIRGGYTTTNWNNFDPDANPTTLDAGGRGRVFYVDVGVGATIEGFRITGGDASAGDTDTTEEERGGGVYAADAVITMKNNRLFGNVANRGGGVYLSANNVTFDANIVTGNTADYGAGLFLDENIADLGRNTISTNTASHDGGGLLLFQSDDVTLGGNTIAANIAVNGGGLLLFQSDDATLNGNTIVANTATNGGGLYLDDSDATLANNVVADNVAGVAGGGLHIQDCSPLVLHNTIARNSGNEGVYVAGDYSGVDFINTILVSHTVGINATAGGAAYLDATLWHANGVDWSGNVAHSNDRSGNPDFAPNAGDYHIGILSAALDQGVNAGVFTDIDDDVRPRGHGYDIGADEYPDLLSVVKWASPTPARAGEQLIYTIRVTNYSDVTYTTAITDVLPDHVVFARTIVSWTGQVIEPGPANAWMDSITVTVEPGYNGLLTNTVEVTTAEDDETGATELVIGCYAVYLPLILRNG